MIVESRYIERDATTTKLVWSTTDNINVMAVYSHAVTITSTVASIAAPDKESSAIVSAFTNSPVRLSSIHTNILMAAPTIMNSSCRVPFIKLLGNQSQTAVRRLWLRLGILLH